MTAYSDSQLDLLRATHDLPDETPRYQFTCAHCRYGYVPFLPCRCPECDRLLTEPVPNKKAADSDK